MSVLGRSTISEEAQSQRCSREAGECAHTGGWKRRRTRKHVVHGSAEHALPAIEGGGWIRSQWYTAKGDNAQMHYWDTNIAFLVEQKTSFFITDCIMKKNLMS